MQDPRSVERLRRGDVATLKRLFKANYAKLYPMAFRLTRDRDAAGGIVRSAFRKLWEERASLDAFEPLDLRLVQRTYAEAMAYRTDNGITGFAVATERVYSQNGNAQAIEQIDEEDQLNYLLFVVDGYSFREVARARGSTVEDVQLSVGRAMTALQQSAHSEENS